MKPKSNSFNEVFRLMMRLDRIRKSDDLFDDYSYNLDEARFHLAEYLKAGQRILNEKEKNLKAQRGAK